MNESNYVFTFKLDTTEKIPNPRIFNITDEGKGVSEKHLLINFTTDDIETAKRVIKENDKFNVIRLRNKLAPVMSKTVKNSSIF